MHRLTKGTLLGRVHDFLKIYLPKQRRVSHNTIRAYRKVLEQLFEFIKDSKGVPLIDITFGMISAETVAAYLEYIEETRGCCISTRNQRFAAVKSFINYVAMMDITVAACIKELEKVPMKKQNEVICIKYMSEAAISAIIAEPDITKKNGVRNRCILVLMYDTGARVQEIADIKIKDFRWGKTPTVTLHGKGGKERTVPLMDRTIEHMRQYLSLAHHNLQNGDLPLFYSNSRGQMQPLSDRRIRDIVKEYGCAAKLKCTDVPDKVHPHLFRHSRAMHLYQHGMDLTLVSQWLGHKNLETTLVYAHADTEHKRKAIETATSSSNPLAKKISSPRFTVNDEETLKRLAGLI